MTIFYVGGGGGSAGLTFKDMTSGAYEVKASDWGNGMNNKIPYYYFAYDPLLKKIEIPNGFTSMESDVFNNCKMLEEAILPNSITSMMVNTFYGCENLVSANLPNNITVLPASTFYNCYYLKEMIVPDSVTTIETSAFFRCRRMEKLTIGSGVTSISASACQQLGSYLQYEGGVGVTLTMLRSTPPTINANTFGSAIFEKIIVPQGSLTAYQTATNWTAYASYMEEAA